MVAVGAIRGARMRVSDFSDENIMRTREVGVKAVFDPAFPLRLLLTPYRVVSVTTPRPNKCDKLSQRTQQSQGMKSGTHKLP